jgi:uncharacterized protein (DUF433 family)
MNLPDFLATDKYGFIHVCGHRIGLNHVVDLYNEGYSPEALAEEFDTLELPLIKQVIAFYLDNKGEVDAYIAESRAEIERQAAAPRRGPDLAELQRRMEALRQAKGE